MTYLKLRSGAPMPGAGVLDYYPYLRSSASAHFTAPQTPELPPAIDPVVSANDAGAADDDDDEGPRKWYQIRFHNPLWVIAGAMGFLFAVMALIVALG
jgi:hypothetical protein